MNLKHILIYSADEKITPWQLKKWEDLFGEQKNLDVEIGNVERFMQEKNIKWTVQGWENYHYKINLIKSKPYIVYYKWNIEVLNNPMIWIVGPRMMSQYAKEVLDFLFEKLKNYNVVTVSWLADGVDKYCHNLSIEKNIPTVAVLGWGFKSYLNWKDRQIIEKIVENWWLVLSEFKLFRPPDMYTFPQRNRIIAWLCDVLFLPEAGVKSWSLITADFALQMKKPIYWTPNNIFSESSKWLHNWIADWKIKLIQDFDSFLDKFFVKKNNSLNWKNISEIDQIKNNFSEKEQKILTILSDFGEQSIQELIVKSWLEMTEIMMILTVLEIENYVIGVWPWIFKRK